MNHFSTIARVIIPFFVHSIFAQPAPIVGARFSACGDANVSMIDPWSFQLNPGALALVNRTTFSATYQSRFLLKEMQAQGFVYIQPIHRGVLSFGTTLQGNQLLRIFRGGMGYSMKLSDKFSAGVQLNYNRIALAENYGKHTMITAECGVYVTLTENWHLGASVFNLGRAKLADFQDERLATRFRLGSSMSLSNLVLLCLEAEKDVEHPLRIKAGIEYLPNTSLSIRAGCRLNPLEISTGFGCSWSTIQLDFATQYNQFLGWTPQVTFSFRSKVKTT
ncbi:MAG: hypothetical protein ACK49D_04960 [Flavobacteriia bacterium]|jgi:hypothetical protein